MYKKIRKLSILLFVATLATTQWATAQQAELALAGSAETMSATVDNDKESALEVKQGTSLADLLTIIKKQNGVTFAYKKGLLNGKIIQSSFLLQGNGSALSMLETILAKNGLAMKKIGDKMFGIYPAKTAYSAFEMISGVVTDGNTGETLPGVNIVIKGTTTGTTTNLDGEYELDAPSLQDTLLFSFIGYQTQEIAIQGRTNIDVELQQQVFQAGDVIVTGYSSTAEKDVTGSISSVSAEDLDVSVASSSALSKLQGKVSGVTVETSGAPGGINTVRIRGISSFGNNDPLYIVDGTPVESQFLNFINPNDIESMQVLKDAAASSVYGARANNGVVIIETKKGQKGSNVQVQFDSKVGLNKPVGGMNDFLIQDPLDIAEIERRQFRNAGQAPPENIFGDPDNPSIPEYIWPNDGVNQTNDLSAFGLTEDDANFPETLIFPANPNGTDWWDAVFGPALVQEHNLNVSGGGDMGTYNVSFNFFEQDGTMENVDYKRGSVRVNTELDAGRFTFGENISFSIDQSNGNSQNGINSGTLEEGSVVGQIIKARPIVSVRDASGQGWSGMKAVGLGNGDNPVKILNADRLDVTEQRTIFGNIFAETQITDNIQHRVTFGFNVGDSEFQNFAIPTPENSEPNLVNSLSEGDGNFTNWNLTNTVSYRKEVNKHRFNTLVGTEAVKDNFRGFSGFQSGFLNTGLSSRFINDAVADPSTKNINTFGNAGTILSVFGQVEYNFDSRYLLTVTARRDGSSRIGNLNTWGVFPAMSAGWRASEESFMSDFDKINELKFRFSWGQTGNQRVPNGAVVDQFGGGTGQVFADLSGNNTSIQQGFTLVSQGNQALEWEENTSYNAGLDLAMFRNRLSFTFDWYQRTTDGLIFNPRIPGAAGTVAPPFQNIGEMRNTGVDFQIGWLEQINDDLQININFNGSHYKNEIRKVANNEDSFFGPVQGRQGILNINQVGQPIGSFFGLVTDGIFANQAEVDAHAAQDGAAPGRFRFKDVNGDGVINADDRTIIGNPHPDFTGGLNLSAKWKNFDFGSFLFMSIGQDIFDLTKEFTVFRLFNTNVNRELLTKSAVVENGQVVNLDEAEFPRLDETDTFSNQYSDFYVEDATYLRVQNLELGYTLPLTGMLENSGFRSLRFHIAAKNVFTLTNYDNVDPALPVNQATRNDVNVNDQGRGIDRGTVPNNKSFEFGVRASF